MRAGITIGQLSRQIGTKRIVSVVTVGVSGGRTALLLVTLVGPVYSDARVVDNTSGSVGRPAGTYP